MEVVQGRTRSLVERFERRERVNSDEVQAPDTTPQTISETAKTPLIQVKILSRPPNNPLKKRKLYIIISFCDYDGWAKSTP